MAKKHTILIVDDHDIVRMGLAALLEESDFEIVGEAGGVSEAVNQAHQTKPDIVLLDVRLPDGSGVDACRKIIQDSPLTKIIMLTSYTDGEALLQSIEAGASGYILKQIGRDALRDSIHRVINGETILDPSLTSNMFSEVRKGLKEIPHDKPNLTQKEQEILLQVAQGKSNKQIAHKLYLSEYTVRNYVSSILRKLKLESRIQLAQYVFQHNENH